jgi:anti-sigma regulatory factor (Ser/Thr protein kinase)
VLPCDAASAGMARRLLRRELDDGAAGAVADVACLLVSELVTNAVVHARTDIVVDMHTEAGAVRVEVSDGSRALPVLPALPPGGGGRATATSFAATGRGLRLLDSLAQRWGADRASDGTGKTVWFELALTG